MAMSPRGSSTRKKFCLLVHGNASHHFAKRGFSEFEHCCKFMTELRWPDGIGVPHCGSDNVTWLAKTRVWKCYAKHPRPTFTLKTGTIFRDSPIPLEKWLCAAWMLITCKNGISSYELHRGPGVTQKTAWFMLHRIRLAMREGGFHKLAGEIEVDETFIGGKARNMHLAWRREKIIGGKGPGGKNACSASLSAAERFARCRLLGVVSQPAKTEFANTSKLAPRSSVTTITATTGWIKNSSTKLSITPSSASATTFTRTRWRTTGVS